MLPRMDGFRVLKELREHPGNIPVLILTARGEESDKVRGLKLGADDYMTKPFGVLEFLARVEALLRRARGLATATGLGPAGSVAFGTIEVDPGTRTVKRNGQLVNLAPKEFDLLEALLSREGRVASRRELMRQVWGYNDEVLSRTVDTHIGELRRKLEEDPASPHHILTVRKVGYRLEARG